MSATTQPNVNSPQNGLPNSYSNVNMLLTKLKDAAPSEEEAQVKQESRPDTKFENQLALVRLGMASSLFYALRAKHPPTAAHALRVALVCSAWAERLNLSPEEQDRIEVAALLHDIGKIGIPDRILRKPGKLTVEEQLTMDCCPQLGCEILRGCTGDTALFDIIRNCKTWFESRRGDDSVRSDAIPLGARMIFIAAAFDSMTTNHVYRNAMSRERALGELIRGRGLQFDPELVADFCGMLEDRPEMLHRAVVNRWLVQLENNADSILCNESQQQANSVGGSHSSRPDNLFYGQLLNNMQDAVAFVDSEGTVTQWNESMEQIMGVAPDAILGQTWSSSALGLRFSLVDNEKTNCPVGQCLLAGISVKQKMLLDKGNEKSRYVRINVSSVVGDTPGSHGAVIILRDISNEELLEERVETLHQKATCDPLTGVANRAFMDESLKDFLDAANNDGKSFSVIICDIDHFKQVNDVHGHLAGDEALVTFASVLSNQSRDGDLVARYGGEEFLLIAADCDNSTATKRAESIRKTVQKTSLPSLAGDRVTASFGVTEFQPGDTPETIVARADRALLKAKDNGRNRVIQMGSGKTEQTETESGGIFGWLTGRHAPAQEVEISSTVPADMVIEKLRGFIADHGAQVINVSENQISLKVTASCTNVGRRKVDHRMSLNVQLTLGTHESGGTQILIQIQPVKSRDRRRRELKGCVGQVVTSLKSYLMGETVKVRRG